MKDKQRRDVTGARRPFAAGLLRQTTLELVRHPVGLATPYRAAARGAALDAAAGRTRDALPPGTPCGSPRGGRRDDAPPHPGGQPPGEGLSLQVSL